MKTNSVDIWMPIFIGDYLAATVRLTTEQHGAYVLLLMDYWRSGPLPDDDKVLAQIAKLTVAKWRRHRPAIAALFTISNGQWVHERQDQEKQRAGDMRARRSVAGRLGAAAKWRKPMAVGMANAWQIDGPLPSPSKDSSAGVGLGRADAGSDRVAHDDF